MSGTKKLSFELEGLSCAACAGRAERAVMAVPGVLDATVNLAARTIAVDAGGVPTVAVQAALTEAGYPGHEATHTFEIEDMTCASCAARIERAVTAAPGVLSCDVNFAARTVSVRYLVGALDAASLRAVIAEAGYSATPQAVETAQDDGQAEETRAARNRMLIALVLTAPVFVLEMGGHLVPAFHHFIGRTIGHTTSWGIQFALTTAVLLWPGRAFFLRGVPTLLRGAPDMNSLVALGAAAAWGYSTLALFFPSVLPPGARVVYFEAAAVIVTLILLGRWLEARARGQTGAAIRTLIGLQPRTAWIDRDGVPVEIPTDSVQVGDVIILRPGAQIPVDGTVTDGTTYVDESMVTGESMPVARGPGDAVIGGSVNGTGALRMRARKVGRDTVLAQIIAMVRQAQGAKLPIQALADRVVRVFVPVVLAVAVVTVAAWLTLGPVPALGNALVAGVSVLIIACPCAMGLATPTSIMVGTGRAAELGVLFRRGDALQGLGQAQVIAFDKTGTLTRGEPVLTDLEVAQGWSEDGALALVAAVEAQSEHPISRAITAAATERGLDVPAATQMRAISGFGIEANVGQHKVMVGAPRLIDRAGLDRAGFDDALSRIGDEGRTPILAAADGQVIAVLAVADPVKPEARAALDALRRAGLRLAMVTGDARSTAFAIAARLGIDHVEAEVLPNGKRDAVERLRTAHGRVVFVGDGINDAPALAEADIGIAMGTGTDVAIESADVVLMSGDLGAVVDAHHLSRLTLRNIRQNLFWAFAYNAALIPVAAGVLYPVLGVLLSPMLAAGAMALSSVFVLSNALRLRAVRRVLGRDDPREAADLRPVTAE